MAERVRGVPRVRLMLALLVTLVASVAGVGSAVAQDVPTPDRMANGLARYRALFEADRHPVQFLPPMSETPCAGGFAGPYPCRNVDLLSFLPLATIGGGQGNDVWGWTDPVSGKEYAIMGRTNGASFVDISDPTAPVYLGNLPTQTFPSTWRDIKVYANHAYIVADLAGSHGLQVFDLTRLRNVQNPPVTFSVDARYTGFGSAHNLNINEETGFAYVVGSNTCRGGLHIVDIRNPLQPRQAGCFDDDGYNHDTQCVIYRGPDATYQGREICFSSNEDTVTIVDVTNKANPVQIARKGYPGAAYTHQGWLTEDHRAFFVDDELDEQFFGHTTWTRLWDVRDVDNPKLRFVYKAQVNAIDHNLYTKGNRVYEANYRSGLRILAPPGVEVGFFDVYPADDQPSFNGSWSNYPYYDSGVVVVSGIEQGLFVLQPNVTGTARGDWLG